MADTSTRGDRIKRSLIQSDYITVAWTWFMVLAGKAAEPVLVSSVLYASVKLLPIVHFPPQLDVVVFIAQFVALDIGGLSLNKLADQATQDHNDEGAKQAKRLSIALVIIMLTGVIMAGVDQVVRLDGQVSTVIDTMLLIARAILAVLYSRVIHSLRNDDVEQYGYKREEIEERITKTVTQMSQGVVAQLSQDLDERLTALDAKQAEAFARLTAEQTESITRMHETVRGTLETVKRTPVRETPPANVRSINEATSRRQPSVNKGERDVDKIIWPLLNSGMTVRAIAERADTSTATVGRSRKRWDAHNRSALTKPLDDAQEATV